MQGYDFYLEKYLIPEFGATRMIEITPGRVRAFYALMRDAQHGRSTVDKCKTVLCSLFNTAVNDRVVGLHPCRGVVTPPVVQAKLRLLTPPEYARLHAHLRDDYARLMVDALLETGCRRGEFAELRVGDLDALACTITVARTVVEVKAKYTRSGGSGFTVKARARVEPGRRDLGGGAGDVQGQRAQLHPRHAVRLHEGLVPVRGVPGGGGRLPGGTPRQGHGSPTGGAGA